MGLRAQVFTEIDWSVIGCDTLLPYYGCQQSLDENYSRYRYSADIEYPEFVPVTDDEASRWRLRRLAGKLEEWPEVSASVGSSRGEGLLDIGFIPIVERGGVFYKIKSFKLVVRKSQIVSASGAGSGSGRYTRTSVLSQGNWYKIRVSKSGVYRLSAKLLSSMGFNDASKVRLYGYGGTLLPETGLETLPDDLQEIPLWRESGNLLFYANGPLSWSLGSDGTYSHTWNTYSEYGCYFVTASDSITPMAVPEVSVDDGRGYTVTKSPCYELYERDAFSWYHSGRRFYDDYDFVNNPSSTYSFNLAGVTDDDASLTVAFSTDGTAVSELGVSVNQKSVGKLVIPVKGSETRAALASQTFKVPGSLFNGNDKIQLYHTKPDGVSGRLDYIRLNFTRELALRGQFDCFRSTNVAGTYSYLIKNAANGIVWRLGAGGSIENVPVNAREGVLATESIATVPGEEFVVLDPKASFPEPELTGPVENQNLHGQESVDMVIIVPAGGKLTALANSLRDEHISRDGLSAIVVPADKIYNEFSSGTPDATAYRRFLKMLFDRAEKGHEPRYLLLFGGGAWDNRMVTPDWRGADPDDFLLCYESDNSISEINSYVADDYYGLLADGKGRNIFSDKVDIGIGRFPVTSVNDAKVMVDKTISYMRGENAGDWQNKVLILGDDGDNNIHMEQADSLSRRMSGLYPALNIKKIYWDAYNMEVSASGNSYPSVRAEILRQLEEGALLVNYTGHGSADVISHELVLDKGDFSKFSSPRLPLWVTASCDITPFDASFESIGMNALLNPSGGALAMFTTARTVYSSENQKVNILFDEFVLDRQNRLGDAVRLAKARLVTPPAPPSHWPTDYSVNKIHYVLLGDPALRLAVPQYDIVVDSVSTGAMQDGLPIAQAGGIVTVSGHLSDESEALISGFNGIVHTAFFDSKRHIVARNNAGSADRNFEYDDYDRMLYAGSDSVRDGHFTLRFPVPKEINYSDAAGRIVLYAGSDCTLSAHGWTDRFLVGGTSAEMSSDTTGPSISLYLNTPDFEYGARVNSTPCLVAELSDEDGINSFGNGVGHDLLLVVDNDPRYTYVLNNYYSSLDGDYRKGRVVYSIPELPEGRHNLMFRAWDVLGNSSVGYLGFVVDEDAGVTAKAEAAPNPAKDRTSFAVSHNRPGSVASIDIQVMDTRGRILWNHKAEGASLSNVSIIDWNLHSDSGQSLQKGLYIFRIVINDTDGSSVPVSGKLLVL